MTEALFSPDKIRSIDHKCLICGGILKNFSKALNDRGPVRFLQALSTKPVLTHESCAELQEFVRRVIYSGKKGETYVETRIRIYEKMKNKSSTFVKNTTSMSDLVFKWKTNDRRL